jgi:hypothetical protein
MTEQTTASIKAAILTVLDGGVGLTDVKTWFRSEPPPVKYTGLFGFVEWAGGQINPEAAQKRVFDNFYIVLARKSAYSEENEDKVLELVKAAEDLLDADPTLGGTTFDSWVSNREIQKYPITQPVDWEIAAVRITLTTWRFKA